MFRRNISLPSSGWESTGFLLGPLFAPEDRNDIFLRNLELFPEPHSVTTQNILFVIITAAIISNATE
jgi:hypothetical protein